jgi:hypothetical protein
MDNQQPSQEQKSNKKSNSIFNNKVVIIFVTLLLLLGLVQLLITIFNVNISNLTFDEEGCKKNFIKDNTLDVYENIDCSTLSSDADIFIKGLDRYMNLPGRYISFYEKEVLSERDNCEWAHQNIKNIELQIEKQCRKPSFFKQ